MADLMQFDGKSWYIPHQVKIGFILGDGIGVDITPVVLKVIDAAVHKAHDGDRHIHWEEILVSDRALAQGKELLPKESLERIKELGAVVKGPLATPVGSGHRSLNVALRQILDLYSCVRPVKWFPGLPAPVKEPQKVDVVLFRENTEDVYAGIEWPAGSSEAEEFIALIRKYGKSIRDDSAIGVKPSSKYGSRRLVRAAMLYALKNGRKSLTLVHKGNIMKFTEGAFKDWGYELLREEFADKIVFEEEVQGNLPADKILVKNRIADAMFQQLLLRPDEYDVIATMNLNGDYLSDALAAQIGGLGMAPGANIGDRLAIFEATHGTAPRHAGKDKANPSSLILSAVMMLRLMGWDEAAALVVKGIESALRHKTVTYDLARQMEGATEVSCSAFGQKIIDGM